MLRINLQHEAESQEMSQVVTHHSFGRAVGTVSERHSGEACYCPHTASCLTAAIDLDDPVPGLWPYWSSLNPDP